MGEEQQRPLACPGNDGGGGDRARDVDEAHDNGRYDGGAQAYELYMC